MNVLARFCASCQPSDHGWTRAGTFCVVQGRVNQQVPDHDISKARVSDHNAATLEFNKRLCRSSQVLPDHNTLQTRESGGTTIITCGNNSLF